MALSKTPTIPTLALAMTLLSTTPAFAEDGQKAIDEKSTETSLRAKAIVLPELPDYSKFFENMSPEELNKVGKKIKSIKKRNAEIDALVEQLDARFEKMDKTQKKLTKSLNKKMFNNLSPEEQDKIIEKGFKELDADMTEALKRDANALDSGARTKMQLESMTE